jgi:hypothetical protein
VPNTERQGCWGLAYHSTSGILAGFPRTFELFDMPTTLRPEIPNTMADTVAAPAQYKQPSRKGKKAWRKNVDVTQIQSGLEDVRDQIIQG